MHGIHCYKLTSDSASAYGVHAPSFFQFPLFLESKLAVEDVKVAGLSLAKSLGFLILSLILSNYGPCKTCQVDPLLALFNQDFIK